MSLRCAPALLWPSLLLMLLSVACVPNPTPVPTAPPSYGVRWRGAPPAPDPARANAAATSAIPTQPAPALSPAPPASEALPPPRPAGPPPDRDQRIQEARLRLGWNARIEVVSDVFILVSPSGYAGFTSAVALAKKAADAYFNNRIHTRPRYSIPIYVFGSASSYDAFCVSVDGARCVSPLGFYDPTLRYVALNAGRGMGSLTHEMMHPLIEVDFPGVPDWFDEGVASLYGKAVFPSPGEVHGATNWRLPELRRALASSRAGQAGVDQLFGMSSDAFRDGRQGLHYAMARYLCQWLDERDQLWSFYHRWRNDFASDPTGEKSFLAVTGQTPQQANAAWIAWVKGLRAGS